MPIDHTVKEGECIESIAFDYGFAPSTITNHPDNGTLLRERGSFDTMIPGDKLVIPDKRQREVSIATGKTHRFRRKGVPARFRVVLQDEGVARAGISYTLKIDGEERFGKTDAEGRVEQWISPKAQRAELELATGEFYTFLLGGLLPVSEEQGVSARLRNLGYGAVDGDESSLRAAVVLFQRAQGLEPTGELDDSLRQLLLDVHGS